MFWFLIRHEDQQFEVAVKPSQLHAVLTGSQAEFENLECRGLIEATDGKARFFFDCGQRLAFTMNLNKFGLLLKGLGLPAPNP